MEDQGAVRCPACGSHRVGTVGGGYGFGLARGSDHNTCLTFLLNFLRHTQLRRNAVTDAEEAMVEASCESCGKAWVVQEQAVGEGW